MSKYNPINEGITKVEKEEAGEEGKDHYFSCASSSGSHTESDNENEAVAKGGGEMMMMKGNIGMNMNMNMTPTNDETITEESTAASDSSVTKINITSSNKKSASNAAGKDPSGNVMKQRRLAMNRASAKARRKNNKIVCESLMKQVVALRDTLKFAERENTYLLEQNKQLSLQLLSHQIQQNQNQSLNQNRHQQRLSSRGGISPTPTSTAISSSQVQQQQQTTATAMNHQQQAASSQSQSQSQFKSLQQFQLQQQQQQQQIEHLLRAQQQQQRLQRQRQHQQQQQVFTSHSQPPNISSSTSSASSANDLASTSSSRAALTAGLTNNSNTNTTASLSSLPSVLPSPSVLSVSEHQQKLQLFQQLNNVNNITNQGQQQQQQQQQQPSTIASSSGGVGSSKDVHGRPIPGSAPSSSMYPPPPLGHHHLHPPGAPIHHGHGHPPPPHPPPPPPPHPSAYNPHQQSHASYTQQYYDYYYHYYGYGAPPPPPPPGYQTGSVPPPPHNPSVAAGPAGAVPPAPPPPGAPPSGYPPAPSPYWAATQPPPSNVNDVNPASAPGHLTHPATAATSQLSSNSATSAITSQVKLAAMAPATIDRNNDNNGNVNHNQEEDDRRMAMALQQQENVMAFEERNRRFGSDRKSSRSSAYCSPGYRPRLLNDRTPSLVDGGIGANGEQTAGGTPTRKKRPAMSDSHFFSHRNPSGSNPASLGHNSHNSSMKSAPQLVGASSGTGVAAAPSLMSQQGIMDHRMAVALQHQEDNAHSHGSNASRKISQSKRGRIGSLFGDVPANFMAWSRGGVAENNDSTATTVSSTMEPNNNRNNSMEMNMSTNYHRESNGYDMDRKPAAATTRDDGNKQELEGLYKQELDGLDHHNDFSCSSFNSRVRVQFKDDSDMLSMSGEGDIIIPLAGINSTGSFTRVRNTFAANNSSNSNSNSKNNHFSPIALNERNQHQPDHHHHQRDDPNRDNKNDNNNSQIHQHRQHQPQDPSLLSQVATHILGTLGGGGGSWKDSDAGPSKRVTTTPTTMPHQDHRQGRNNRNRSPETGVELGQEVVMEVRDESSMPPPQPRGSGVQIDWPSRAGCHTWIPDTIGASASAMFGHNGDGNEQHHDHHQEMAHANDHSLTRHSIYGRADISPINSMDMDFSHSSHVGESRRRNHDDGGGGNSSLLNVFDQKHDDPNPEELLPHIHRSVLQQVPSWDRSFRSGDASVGGADEMDDSLIRVHSHDAMKPMGHDFRQRYQQPQHHHSQPAQPQTNHHQSQHRDRHQQTQSSPQPQPQQQNYHHESRDMDWEEHAGE